jgi:hypothetical protein
LINASTQLFSAVNPSLSSFWICTRSTEKGGLHILPPCRLDHHKGDLASEHYSPRHYILCPPFTEQ